MWYEEYYKNSLQMINDLKIKSEKQYNELVKDNEILSSESLKNITHTRDFKKIIQIKEVI